MTVKAKDIVEYIESIAPVQIQEDWDNTGLQIGNLDQEITSIYLAMDLTDVNLDQAIEKKSNFILTHHPLFFSGIKSIDYNTYKGNLLKRIIQEEIFCYASHTSLDKAKGGVNDLLADILLIEDRRNFQEDCMDSIGIYGPSKLKSLEKLIDKINWKICPLDYIRIYGRKHQEIKNLAVVGGSGGSMVGQAIDHGCDCLVTGDVKHHDGQEAYENDLMLIDISHFYSELPILIDLADKLEENFKIETYVSKDPVWIHKL